MRIGIIHPGMDIKGGAENIVVWLAAGLQRRGHEMRIFTDRYSPEHWPQEFVGSLDFQIMAPGKLGSFLNSTRMRMYDRVRQLPRLLKGFDVVIGQHFPTYCWATMARKLAGAPWRVVWMCQEPHRMLHTDVTDEHLLNHDKLAPPGVENSHLEVLAAKRSRHSWARRRKARRNKMWDAKSVRKCDLVLTNSRFTADNVRRIFDVEAHVCSLGIPLPPETEYRRGEYVGVVGPLGDRKNIRNVVRAAAQLIRDRGCHDLRVLIAGDGPQRSQLAGEVSARGIDDNIEFVGRIDDAALSEFYRNARLIAYCPIDEPFGLVPLEALAAGTPVVVSNHGGPAEIIKDGITGLHANPFAPSSIADAIEILWTNESKARQIALAGQAEVRRGFSLEAFVDRFEEQLTQKAL